MPVCQLHKQAKTRDLFFIVCPSITLQYTGLLKQADTGISLSTCLCAVFFIIPESVALLKGCICMHVCMFDPNILICRVKASLNIKKGLHYICNKYCCISSFQADGDNFLPTVVCPLTLLTTYSGWHRNHISIIHLSPCLSVCPSHDLKACLAT